MYLFGLFTLPTSSTLLADIGAVSTSIFTDLLPIGVFVIGVALAFTIATYLIKWFRRGRR